jgi:hypothetical protein
MATSEIYNKNANSLESIINSFIYNMIVILYIIQVWTQKCAVQKASVDVNISLNKIFFKLNIFVQIHVGDS